MILIGLPVDFDGFDGNDKPNSASALVIHARKAGLSLQSFDETHLRRRIHFKVSFPGDTEFENFRVEAETVWKDVYFWEDWKGYQYALKFAGSLKDHYLKLNRLLCRLAGMEQTPPQTNHRGVSV